MTRRETTHKLATAIPRPSVATAGRGATAFLSPSLHPSTDRRNPMLDVLIGAAVEVAAMPDRELHLSRPSRGAYSAPVRAAADTPKKWSAFAQCVLRRESGATLANKESREDARNGSSSAAGRHQWLAAWQNGGAFMVRDRLVRFGMPKDQAKRVREYMQATPMWKIDGWLQDVLFNEVVTRSRDGWRHWYLAGSACNQLVPAVNR